jgi:membrane-bound serine protease (ClpP class)
VGKSATVRRAGAAGNAGSQAFLEGAWWRIRSTGAPVDEGSVVRVVGVDGLDLLVEPAAPVSDRPDSDEDQLDNRGKDHE